jgi:uncharacterized protein (DUF1697 family)
MHGHAVLTPERELQPLQMVKPGPIRLVAASFRRPHPVAPLTRKPLRQEHPPTDGESGERDRPLGRGSVVRSCSCSGSGWYLSAMPRYAAFLRGVSPMNAKMPELKKAFEAAGFTDVSTLLSSGNLVFTARAASEAALQKKVEAAMTKELGRAFLTIVRPIEALREMLASDPYQPFRLPSDAKRIVTFLRERPASKLALPAEIDGARILAVDGNNVFSAYRPTPKGPVFMTLILKTFGSEQTTRTWQTVSKVAR